MIKKLNLPEYNFRLKTEDKKTKIFDSIRRKYIVLTPEEWVRQNLIQYLIQEKNYPAGLIGVEKSLVQNGLKRRSDIILFDRNQKAQLLVECKAPEIPITQATFDQISRYNIHYKVPFLLISNGLQHYVCQINFKTQASIFLSEVPDYHQLLQID